MKRKDTGRKERRKEGGREEEREELLSSAGDEIGEGREEEGIDREKKCPQGRRGGEGEQGPCPIRVKLSSGPFSVQIQKNGKFADIDFAFHVRISPFLILWPCPSLVHRFGFRYGEK